MSPTDRIINVADLSGIPRAHEHPLLSARPEAQRSVTYPWDSPGDGCWDSILRHVRRGFPLYRLMLVATDVADTVRREQIEGFDLDIHAAGDKAVGYLRPQGMPSAMAEQLAQHSIIAAMARANEVMAIDLREAVARQVDAERALEEERRAAAKVRQILADAVNSMGSARDMTGDPNVARYLALAIEQAEFPLTAVMR